MAVRKFPEGWFVTGRGGKKLAGPFAAKSSADRANTKQKAKRSKKNSIFSR